MIRRDSILKHSGSVKNTDRRVSIKQNQPVVVEYLSERRPSVSAVQTNAQQSSANSGNTAKPNARPASLIVTKGERPTFKLIRSPSIDHEQDFNNIKQMNMNMNMNQSKIIHSNAAHSSSVTDSQNILTAKDDDEYDESAPLVQNVDTTTIKSSTTHSNNL